MKIRTSNFCEKAQRDELLLPDRPRYEQAPARFSKCARAGQWR
jgi:hypothetical protein